MELDRYDPKSQDAKWRHDVKYRAAYRCEVCNKKNKALFLHAHHLNSYADYPEQRVDIKNGKCLCKKCHDEFHEKFGYHVTAKEFDVFLKSYKVSKLEKERQKIQKKVKVKHGKLKKLD